MPHILSEITVRNFRSIKDESFELSPFTPLVGYNNAGKSNLLKAIEWLLRKGALSDNSFFDVTLPVEVVGVVVGLKEPILDLLTAPHRASVTPFIQNESLTIKRVLSAPGGVANVKLFVRDHANIGNLNEWKPNPNGIDQAIQSLFPEPIFVGAMEDSGEDVGKNKNTTTIGKLLSEIIGPIQANHTATIQNALDQIKNLLDAEGIDRAPELTVFDNEVNKKVDSFFPGVSVKIHIPSPELKEVFAKGTIKVFEDADLNGKDISALGHGAQRSIQMALIRHLADSKRAANIGGTNTLLLIDEPELYLHPQAIEILRDALTTLSSEGYQVIFSTHSPSMITSRDVADTVLVRKNAARGTYRRQSLRAAVPSVVAAAPSQLELTFSLSHSANVLFSERVVLAEGTTENRILPKLVEKVTSKTLGMHKAALVVLSGSGSMKKAIEILAVMDLPTKALVDMDYILKKGESDGCIAAGNLDIIAISNHLSAIAAGHGINLDGGWPTKENSSMSAAKAFQLLAAEVAIEQNIIDLHEEAKANGIWMWKKGDIESHLNCLGKSEHSWASFCSDLFDQDLHVFLPNDHAEISDCISWLLE